MTKIFQRIILLLLVFSVSHAAKSVGKLDQAVSTSTRINVMQKVGETFLQIGSIQSSQSNRTSTTLLVGIIALVTVIVLCLASQCIVHHAKSCQKELNRYHQQQLENQEFTEKQPVFIANQKAQYK